MTLVAAFGMHAAVFAQEDDGGGGGGDQKLRLGIRAGFNYSNVWDEQGQDFVADSKVGFAGGAFVGIPLGRYLGIQPEVLISQKGFTGSGTLMGSHYSYTQTTTFLDVPIQLQFKPVRFLTIVGGPQFSFLMRENDTYTFGDDSGVQEQQFDNDNIRKNILGIVGGVDVHILSILVSGRVCWDLQYNKGDGTSETPRYRNQWVQLTLGFRI